MGFRLFDNPLHLVLLLVVILIVFGAGKLPSVGSALGQSIKEFKKASIEPDDKKAQAAAGDTCEKCQTAIPAGAQFCPACGAPARPLVAGSVATAPQGGVACAQCGAKNAASARFCAQCGSAMNVHAG